MIPAVSERCDLRLYDTVTQRGEELKKILFPYPELWKTETDALSIPEKQDGEILTGIIGEQSSGKSTLLNSICGYPILPAASVITSARPVEIRKSKREYIQVVWTDSDQSRNIDFSQVKLEETFVRDLLEYSIKCCRNNIITCDNLNYLTTKSIRSAGTEPDLKPEDFDLFDPSDPRQVMMLLMILLGSHVGAGGIRTQSDIREEIKSRHRQLMACLGLDGEKEFTVQLFWNSPLLCDGAVLMDLPGLRDTAGRSTVTLQQLHRLDAAVLLFSPKQEEPDLYRFAQDFLRKGKPTPAPGSLSRITAVLNMADICSRNLEEILSSVRKKCGFPKSFPVYPICAASGEYLYTVLGDVDPRATFLYKSNPQWTPEEGSRALYEAFCRPYQSVLLQQTQKRITEELTGRIRDLSGLNWLLEMTDEIQDIRRRITLQHSFLTCLEKCGSIFTKYIYEALSSACSETQQVFHSKFLTAADRLLDKMLAAEDFQTVESEFRSSLKQMEADIAQQAEDHFRRMKRKNFRISLDDDRNKGIFLDLYRWLSGSPDPESTAAPVAAYLQPGILRLEQVLDLQYQTYCDGVAELIRKYPEFPRIFDSAFAAACDNAEKVLLSEHPSLTEGDLMSYRQQSVLFQNIVSDYLTQTIRARIRILETDRTVAEEFSKTAELLRGYQQNLESFYLQKWGQMLLQSRKSPLLKDDIYLSLRQFRKLFKNSFYAAEAKNTFFNAVRTLLTADANPEPPDRGGSPWQLFAHMHRLIRQRNTHPRRIRLAMDSLSRKFAASTEKDLRRFSSQMKRKAKSLMNSEKNVYAAEKKQLSELNARILSQISVLKTDLNPLLQQMQQNNALQQDAAVLIKRLNEL